MTAEENIGLAAVWWGLVGMRTMTRKKGGGPRGPRVIGGFWLDMALKVCVVAVAAAAAARADISSLLF